MSTWCRTCSYKRGLINYRSVYKYHIYSYLLLSPVIMSVSEDCIILKVPHFTTFRAAWCIHLDNIGWNLRLNMNPCDPSILKYLSEHTVFPLSTAIMCNRQYPLICIQFVLRILNIMYVYVCRWLVLAVAMTRYYFQKGTHKGLYRSIARILTFFQTFAVLEVSAAFFCSFFFPIEKSVELFSYISSSICFSLL